MAKYLEDSSGDELPIEDEDEDMSEEGEFVTQSDHDSMSEQDYVENENSESDSDDEIAQGNNFFFGKRQNNKMVQDQCVNNFQGKKQEFVENTSRAETNRQSNNVRNICVGIDY